MAERRQWHPTPVLLPGNPVDRGAWWAVVHGVAKSWTRLKRLSSSSSSSIPLCICTTTSLSIHQMLIRCPSLGGISSLSWAIRKPMGCSPSLLKEYMFCQKKTCGQINSLESNGCSPGVPRLRKGQRKRDALAFWGSPVCLIYMPGVTEQLFSSTRI